MKDKKSIRPRLNPTKVRQLYSRLKNVGAVAKELDASYMGIRRNLIAQGVELIPARQPQTIAAAATAAVKNKTNKQDIEAITRSVTHAIAADAPMQLPAMTRADFFETVRAAVAQATRKVGFRPVP